MFFNQKFHILNEGFCVQCIFFRFLFLQHVCRKTYIMPYVSPYLFCRGRGGGFRAKVCFVKLLAIIEELSYLLHRHLLGKEIWMLLWLTENQQRFCPVQGFFTSVCSFTTKKYAVLSAARGAANCVVKGLNVTFIQPQEFLHEHPIIWTAGVMEGFICCCCCCCTTFWSFGQ